jgi:aminopeptidase N
MLPSLRLRTLVHLAFLGLPFAALAQPNPYGCHYFRHGAAPHPVSGDAARTQIAETIARSDTFDILHYDIHLDVTNYSGAIIKAATTVSFAARMPDLEFIRFDLFDLEVDSVVEGGEHRTFTYDGAFLKVDLPTPPLVGEERALTVYYHGHPHRDPDWGGFYFESGYIYNLGIGISTIPPNFGKVWYPCFDSFVERATYTYHVKSAGTYRLHGQGDFIGEIQLGGDTVIRSYHLPQAVPTHISAVAVSDYSVHESVHQGVNGEIPVTLAAKPANLSNMVARFGDLGAAIDACEHWYGPYAYGRVGYVLTTDGALEIPTNVAYPAFMVGQSASQNRDLYSHELGHHWWGDIVTPHVHNDMWLKEGPNGWMARRVW